jgi:hypothetical protein
MKFIFTLRNPIERTWANYRYTVLQGLEDLSFEDALKNEAFRISQQTGIWAEIQPHNYTGRGFYAAQLRQYLDLFPRKSILLIKSELLSSQTNLELAKILTFLDLTVLNFDYVRAPDHTSVNVLDPKLQMQLRSYFGDRFDKVIEAARKNEGVEKFIASPSDEVKINLLKDNMTSRKIAMPKASREYLRELFAKDIEDLGGLVDFDLTDWN